MKRALILLACLSALTAVAGCGGGGGGGGQPLSKAAYEQQMQALDRGSERTLDRLSFDDPSDVGKELKAAADLLDETSQRLAQIEPPEDVADQHQVMVEKSAAAANRLRDLAENATLGDILGLMETSEFDELHAAASRIKAKGYAIGGGW